MKILPASALGHEFVPTEFLPEGQDENYLRNEQINKGADAWRHLRSDEIEALVKNGVTCSDWDVLGMPVATSGIDHPSHKIHAPNENISMDDFLMGAKHAALVMERFAERGAG